ncbi:response regulator [Candidatus Woesearchaeota archaeon]|nr:response regulator [Candidatus Woesearchaeota archaeon]
MSKILIVEDELLVAKDIQQAIERFGHGPVMIASNGLQAIEISKEFLPHLILMDIRLGGNFDGTETARLIQKSMNMPIIYLTAFSDQETIEKAKMTNPYGYIMKPFDDKILESTIQIALHKHQTEKKLKHYYSQTLNVINFIDEAIISVDKKGTITSWNNAISKKTGIHNKDIFSKNIFKDEFPKNISPWISMLKNTLLNCSAITEEFEVRDSVDEKRTIEAQTSLLKEKEIEGAVLIGRDITETRKLCREIVHGFIYLSCEELIDEPITLFNEFTKKGYSGMYVSRETPEKQMLAENAKIRLMKHTQGMKGQIDSNEIFNDIFEFIECTDKPIVLLNRLDYITAVLGFHNLLTRLYMLNDLIRGTECIIIVHMHPKCFLERELAMFKEEFRMLPKNQKESTLLEEKMIQILHHISAKNTRHSAVKFKSISNEFRLSRITTKNWLEKLKSKGLIFIEKRGRAKHVMLTEKGREIVHL